SNETHAGLSAPSNPINTPPFPLAVDAQIYDTLTCSLNRFFLARMVIPNCGCTLNSTFSVFSSIRTGFNSIAIEEEELEEEEGGGRSRCRISIESPDFSSVKISSIMELRVERMLVVSESGGMSGEDKEEEEEEEGESLESCRADI